MTVEELQDEFLKFILPRFQWGGIAAMICHDPKIVIENGLKEIVAAAHAEGVAEGAEELRTRLLETAIRNRASDTYVVLASVLAPKEKP